MSYSDFSLNKVCQAFSLATRADQDIFGLVQEAAVSGFPSMTLEKISRLGIAIGTEKARSEFIIAPLLAEAREMAGNGVSLFSGVRFTVEADKGLDGVCDFMFSRSSNIYEVVAPVLMVVEAKNEDISGGLGQCAAEMVAARIFNGREGTGISTIYGAGHERQ